MPPFIDHPWAKLAYDDDRNVVAALPLLDHCFDVAAAMAALLAGGAWTRALERTADRPLTEQDHARLIALAALHDIGKANKGFQARWRKGADRVGHEPQVAALLNHAKLSATEAGQGLLGIVRAWGAAQHLAALMAHHGRPREEFGGPPPSGGPNRSWEKHVNHWLPADDYNPSAEAADLIEQARARWPLAWEPGPKLPDHPRFVAIFAGMMTLADWLGSDTKRFPVEGPYGDERIVMREREAAAAVAARGLLPLATPIVDFTAAFDVSQPRGVQQVADADDLGPVALIEAETGSGKTEAALWRWLHLRRAGEVDGLYFALPPAPPQCSCMDECRRC